VWRLGTVRNTHMYVVPVYPVGDEHHQRRLSRPTRQTAWGDKREGLGILVGTGPAARQSSPRVGGGRSAAAGSTADPVGGWPSRRRQPRGLNQRGRAREALAWPGEPMYQGSGAGRSQPPSPASSCCWAAMTVAALHQGRRRSRGLAARLTAVVVVVAVVLAVVVAYHLITRGADVQLELLAGLVRVIVVILLGVFVAGSGRALCLRPADPFDSRGPDSADPRGPSPGRSTCRATPRPARPIRRPVRSTGRSTAPTRPRLRPSGHRPDPDRCRPGIAAVPRSVPAAAPDRTDRS
jgi:hypothetical protein